MSRCFAVFLLFMLLAGAVPAAEPTSRSQIPVETFIAPDAFADIKISPDGKHLAASVPMEDRSLLVMLDASDMSRVGVLGFKAGVYLNEYEWANGRQIVYSVASRQDRLSAPVVVDALNRVNLDGSDSKQLVPATSYGWTFPVQLIDGLRDDDDHVLVRYGLAGVAEISLDKDRTRIIKGRSTLDTPRYIVDNAGDIRFVLGHFGRSRLPRLDQRVGNGWVVLNDEAASDRVWRVLGFSADNRTAYLAVQETEGPDGLYAFDMATRERTRLLSDEHSDPVDVVRSPQDGAVVAVRYLGSRPQLGYVQPEHPLAREIRKIERAFKGQSVWPTSFTRDGGKAVYRVSSDVNSGEYYLVDHVRGKASFIAAANDKLVPGAMSPMRAVRYRARDGIEIEALLTVPASWPAGRSGPMVVMPHDGPRGQSDSWKFDRQVQLLASRGYAVLQPNFRGSAGKGLAFHRLGDGQWGGSMVDDVIDATRWAQAEGVAQPGRICLYGFGYGGYVAMMGLAREPGLYACGIGDAGLYNLGMMYSDETLSGTHRKAFLDELLGPHDVEKASPVGLAASIKAPVLIGAGKNDDIVPVDHSRGLHRALRGAGVPVELVVYADEAHGNFLPNNRLNWANRVLALLDRTIGDKRAAAAAP